MPQGNADRAPDGPEAEISGQTAAPRLRRLIFLGASKVAGPAGAAVVTRAGQMLLAFVLARSLGVEGYGLFVFAVGGAALAGMVAGFGWPNVINREMPRLIRQEAWGLLRGMNRAADLFTIAFAAVLASALLAGSFYFAEFAIGLRLAALMTVPIALVYLRQQQLVAVDRPVLSMTLDQGMAASLVLLIALIRPFGPQGTIMSYCAVVIALVAVGTLVFRGRLPPQVRSVTATYRWREWIGSGASMFSSLLSRILVTRIDALLVAPLAGLADAGIFGGAFRLSLLMTFPQFILQSVVTPRFSRAFAAGDHHRVRQLYAATLAFAGITALPFLLPALIAPSLVMGTLFGPEFAAGGPTLFWLAMGQFVAAFGISLNSMIAMGGDHKAMGRQGVAIAVLTMGAGLLVVPRYGAEGAAIVLVASNALWVAGMARLARPLLGRGDGREPSAAGARTAPSKGGKP